MKVLRFKPIPPLLFIPLLLTCVQPQQPMIVPSASPPISAEKAVDQSRVEKDELVRGDNLLDMVLRQGVDGDLADELVMAVATRVDMVRLQPGQEGTFYYGATGNLERFCFRNNEESMVEVIVDGDELTVYDRIIPLSTRIRLVRCTVESSLYNAAVDGGMPLNVFMDMIQLFSFDVDFQRDIYSGDFFEAAYEEIYDAEGELVDYGEVVMARMFIRGQTQEFQCYRYTNLEGTRDWYDPEGGTVRKELLKTPISGAYISSGFGQRVSPITGFSHKHRGVDFAAPTGTPIMSSGNGVIVRKGWSDVYGWFIQIRHANHYQTLYAHLSAFARDMRQGRVVDQGQVIGYVGNTGMSTGPHCHYEVIYYGTKINPIHVKFPPGESLKGDDLELFHLVRKSLISSFY